MGKQAYGQQTENLNKAIASINQGHRQSLSALWKDRDFLGGPVVETVLPVQGAMSLIPGRGTEILQTTQHSRNK